MGIYRICGTYSIVGVAYTITPAQTGLAAGAYTSRNSANNVFQCDCNHHPPNAITATRLQM